MINLSKSHLGERQLKILGHKWQSGGTWLPEPTKLEGLLGMTHEQLAKANRPSLYGLLNFFREYIPRFAEITEPVRALLSKDHTEWTIQATEAVHNAARVALG